MAYFSASKNAAMVRSKQLTMENKTNHMVIPTTRNRSGMILVSSRGTKMADVKPISRNNWYDSINKGR